jgi:hypothetical protein
MEKYSCTYHNALKIIAKDFGYIQSDDVKRRALPEIKVQPKFESEKETFIQVEIKDFSESELKWWKSFGISEQTLKKYKIYSVKTVFLNGSIYAQSTQHSPIYGYYFGKQGAVEQWRIYIPKRKEFRFIGNVPTKTIQGYKQLPEGGKLLVITKSMKDVCLLSTLGIPAVAPNSETQFVSDKVLDEFRERFKNIVLLYDSDLTGVRFMNKIRKQHRDLIVCMIPRKYEAKDISDFYQKYGKSKTIELIKESIKHIKHEKEIA